MYETFFQLRHRPFLAAPSISAYFPAGAIEHARGSLIQCIERGQGPALLIGPAGTGKSLLCALLADHFRTALNVALLAHSGLCTRRALFQSILFALRQRHRGTSEGDLRLTLLHYLETAADCPQGVLLIVDEAHTLPVRLLEELRILTNLARDGQSRVRLVLAGGPALEERFTDPRLESFHQRIACRCYLQGLNRDETMQYVRAQLALADGVPESILDDGALRAIHRATDGIPRLINQLGDAALVQAARRGRRPIDAALIEEVWAELQQLPAPWQTPPDSATSGSGIIEFGQLAEDVPATSMAAQEQAFPAARGLHAERSEGNEIESPEPPPAAVPLVEANPFGDGFEEEEEIRDRYSTLEATASRLELRIPSSAAPGDAEVMPNEEPPTEEFLNVESVIAPIQNDLASWNTLECGYVDAVQIGGETAETMPPDVPPVPEERAESWRIDRASEAEIEEEQPAAPLKSSPPPHVRVIPADDRDLLIVEEDGSTHRPRDRESHQGRARRQEYRQLFAQLRRRP